MTTVLVQIGQGWPEEWLNTLSLEACEDVFKRLKDAFDLFPKKYEVAALLNPAHANWDKTVGFLDRLVKYVPYAIDFITSDNLALGWVPQNRPYDIGHLVSLPVQLARYLSRLHGKSMLGGRVHELFSLDYSAQCLRDGSLNWLERVKHLLPPKRVLDWDYQSWPFYLMAEEKKWVFVADPLYQGHLMHWPGNRYNYNQVMAEWQVVSYSKILPKTAVLGVANNVNCLPYEYAYWNWIKPLLEKGDFLGDGLSCQGWMFPREDGVPVGPEEDVLVRWVRNAADHKFRIIQLEPSWALLHMEPGSPNLGAARPLLMRVAAAL